jgi:hypothetical protein
MKQYIEGITMGPTYKDYVIKEKQAEFVKHCKENCLDFYSCGCILTAHLVMQKLMQHTYEGVWRREEVSPKNAWNDAMKQTNYHSGCSAGFTASIVSHFSPRGKEFQEWWNKRCGGTGNEKGTINPAILTLKVGKSST